MASQSPKTLKDLQARAAQVRQLYGQLETKKHGTPWTREELALGMVGDIGSLAKSVLAAEGRRDLGPSANPLGHHLADMLWSVLVLAEAYDVDLETAFLDTTAELETKIKAEL
jgi:NTP pyrophosphatase (non-canonical NTP hydrolase)